MTVRFGWVKPVLAVLTLSDRPGNSTSVGHVPCTAVVLLRLRIHSIKHRRTRLPKCSFLDDEPHFYNTEDMLWRAKEKEYPVKNIIDGLGPSLRPETAVHKTDSQRKCISGCLLKFCDFVSKAAAYGQGVSPGSPSPQGGPQHSH